MRFLRRLATVAVVLLLGAATARAHVPYLETQDFTHDRPFRPPIPQQSIAVYAWLEAPDDVDVYAFQVRERTPFLAEVLVPVHPQYAAFRPAFALIGPGLPPLPIPAPFVPLAGYGALVYLDDGVGPRRQFYEPFGGKSYWQGPRLERVLEPGRYALVYWDPQHRRGDYVAVIGRREMWRLKDVTRALRVTPLIRRGRELHLDRTRESAR